MKFKLKILLIVLAVVLVLSITAGVSLGTVNLPFKRVWEIIFAKIFNKELVDVNLNEISIVWQIRLPRVLTGAIVGAGLAIAGTVIQSLVRNSLADPYLLGISSGACTGAVFMILFASSLFNIVLTGLEVYFAAFLGAMLAFILVFFIAGSSKGGLNPVRMILSGLAVSYIFSAITNFMVYLSQHNGAESAMFWMLGGLGGARWGRLGVPFVIVILALIIFMLNARNLNALLLGDESAAAVGVDIVKFRRFLFVASSVLTGVIVAVSGSIGFVGLIVPHAVRLIAGADHERVLPIGALAGAIFLIWADLFSRTVLAPRELPLGIITGFVGAPFFIWLLTRNKH
ncbi:MAG: iron ABC transporter permease [Synergistaceae bacterium]|nr:iron ABC transporter permease [Synergistaceae bacterium]MBQ9896364.1 iron ABC transporter permease [Synergistaceae bacterium]